MTQFYKLKHSGYGTDREVFEIPQDKRLSFSPIGDFTTLPQIVNDVFDFAYGMSFGNCGEHRPNRSGGSELRNKGKIFVNVFQGKLAEFALYEQMKGLLNVSYPDTNTYGRGIWDITDLTVQNNIDVSVKSTKKYGNLLLLETNDWNQQGVYLPNNKQYMFHFLVRISPDLEGIFEQYGLLNSDYADRITIGDLINKANWQYDSPRFITNQELIYLISNGFVIPKGSFLNNGKKPMDAENYYVKAYDMHTLNEIIGFLPK